MQSEHPLYIHCCITMKRLDTGFTLALYFSHLDFLLYIQGLLMMSNLCSYHGAGNQQVNTDIKFEKQAYLLHSHTHVVASNYCNHNWQLQRNAETSNQYHQYSLFH